MLGFSETLELLWQYNIKRSLRPSKEYKKSREKKEENGGWTRENVGVLAQSCDMLASIVDRFVLLHLPSLSFVGLVFIDLLTPSQDDENRWLRGRRWLSWSEKRCEDALMFWRRREMMCRWNITLPCNDASSFVSKRRDKLKWIWLGAKAGSKDFLSTKLINSL